MRSNRGRGLLAVLGMALAAMMALGAFSASAQAASWHIKGKTLEQQGIASASFKSQGTFDMDIPGWGTHIYCQEAGSGAIFQGSAIEAHMNLSGCEIAEAEEACDFEPATINLKTAKDGKVRSQSSPYLVNLKTTGGDCFWPQEAVLVEPANGFAMAYGPEGVELDVGITGLASFGGEPMTLSGSSTWTLLSGQTFGYW